MAFLVAYLWASPTPNEASADTVPIKVLILGDSYSAGNGAGDYEWKLCRRSPNAWGALLAASSSLNVPGRPVEVSNRACTGGVARDIVSRTPGGVLRERDRLLQELPGHAITSDVSQSEANTLALAQCKQRHRADQPDEYLTAKANALPKDSLGQLYYYTTQCFRYVRSQITSVKSDLDLVVMTIGGNDLGFADIVAKCLVSIPYFGRDADKCDSQLSKAERLIADKGPYGFEATITRVVKEIDARLNPASRTGPRGRILLLAYPGLVSDDNYTFGGVKVGARLKKGVFDVQAIQTRVMNSINNPSAGACRNQVGLFAPTVGAAFEGHEPDVPVGTDGSQSSWLWEVLIDGPAADADTFHPKPAGHRAEAAVAGSRLDATDFKACLSPALPEIGGLTIAAGGTHSCAIVTGTAVRCWGVNAHGQLGDGSFTTQVTPVTVTGLSGATAVSAGQQHSCALAAGAVKCWGLNSLGQLGDGSIEDSGTPVNVAGLTGATAIATGLNHSCAIVAFGAVRCWGSNDYGQLGNGSVSNPNVSVSVSGLTGATAITAGAYHSCAIIAGGVAKCWGYNNYGQLGNGSVINSSVPASVSGLTGATAITAGAYHSCAIVAGGAVSCWGATGGNGSSSDSKIAVAVSGMTGATRLAAGGRTSCAIISGGAVKCWGWNRFGQLGDGTNFDSVTPVNVSGVTAATTIAVGAYHSCAILGSGFGKCWGQNEGGKLGNGSLYDSNVPASVVGIP